MIMIMIIIKIIIIIMIIVWLYIPDPIGKHVTNGCMNVQMNTWMNSSQPWRNGCAGPD